jgi:tetratricopeptide (TPR) repeat protein
MTVLEGSVRKAEKKLRVNTQLVNVADGFQLWSGKYEREMAELFVIQDEITCAIVEVLKVRLIGEAGKSLIKHYTANTDAYHLYLKGRYYWNQRGLGLQKGMHYFELALLEDPNYALAHSGLADTFALLGFYGYWPNREAFPKAKAAALKALEIDEALAEAHTSLGLVFFLHDWDFVRAEQEYKRAIALNPNYAPARYWHAWFLSALNRMDEALAEDLLAIEIDPLSVYAITQLGWMRYHARQFDQAAADFRKALQLESNSLTAHWLLGKTMLCQSKFPEALAALEKAARLSGQSSWMTAWLGFGYGMAGKSDAAQQVLLSLQEKSQHAYVPPFLFAIVFTGLGDNDQAFAWLQKARQEREEWFVWLPVEPAFDPLRSDPRFSEMLAACQLGST